MTEKKNKKQLSDSPDEYKKFVTDKLSYLAPYLQRAAMGDFDKKINITKDEDEFTELAVSINLMIEDLEESRKENKKLLASLKGKVESRTQELTNSQLRYKSLIEASPDLVWEIDENDVFTFCSDTYKKVLGYSPKELVGKTVYSIMPREEVPGVKKEFEKIKKNPKRFVDLINKNVTKSGKVLILLSGGVPIIDRNGEYKGFRGIDKDITEKAKREAELAESKERFELAVKGANDGLWDWDMRTNKVFFSDRWKSMLGYKPNEIKNDFSEWEKLLHPEDKKRAQAYVDTYLKSKGALKFEHEFRLLHKSGLYVDILARATMQKDKNGEPIRLVGTHIDMTARKQYEESLKQSETRFRQLFDSMLSGVAMYDVRDNGKSFFFKDINHSAERLDKVLKKNVVGKKVEDVFPGVVDFGLLKIFFKVWKTGEPVNFPIKEYNDERISGWRDNYIFKLTTGEVVAIYNDVTTAKQAQSDLKQKLNDLERMNKLMVGRELKMIELKERFNESQDKKKK